MKPTTPLEDVSKYLCNVDVVLVMGVEPGICGQKFLPNTCDRIEKLESMKETNNLEYKISVDGGINETTVVCVEISPPLGQ